MPILTLVNRRLLLRYETGRSVSFTNVRDDAEDAGMFTLGTAIGSIQEESPQKICTVVTRHIMPMYS